MSSFDSKSSCLSPYVILLSLPPVLSHTHSITYQILHNLCYSPFLLYQYISTKCILYQFPDMSIICNIQIWNDGIELTKWLMKMTFEYAIFLYKSYLIVITINTLIYIYISMHFYLTYYKFKAVTYESFLTHWSRPAFNVSPSPHIQAVDKVEYIVCKSIDATKTSQSWNYYKTSTVLKMPQKSHSINLTINI